MTTDATTRTPQPTDPIDVLDFSTRVRNCLYRDCIFTIAALLDHSGQDLLDIRNFGDGCLREVVETLARHGLALSTKSIWSRDTLTTKENNGA